MLQLIESLQLNQASLEQPDSVTKRLVRYLATKAKQLDRLNVVKHLKDITPAGTIGKLVIRSISIHIVPVTLPHFINV